jgi:hypothetical protein
LNPASNNFPNFIVQRMLTFTLGCAGLIWGVLVFPLSETADNFRDLENRLLRFETYSQETVTPELENGSSQYLSPCDTHSQRAMLLLEIPLAEATLRSGATTAFDHHIQSLETRSRQILSCTPRESFVWLVTFDLEILHGLLNEHSFDLLGMSYQTSSSEAWISIRRNAVAAPLLLIAPKPLQKMILAEFQQLIRDGFLVDAARSYSNASQPVQAVLKTKIDQFEPSRQRAFSDAVQKLAS